MPEAIRSSLACEAEYIVFIETKTVIPRLLSLFQNVY